MIGRIPAGPARGFICDKCKRPADVLYVQRGQFCGRCAYPEAYAKAQEKAPEWARGLEQLPMF